MTANYIKRGEVIDYPATKAIKYGEVVVMPDCIGVAASDIAEGDTGVLYITGVYEMPAEGDIAIGSRVYFDLEKSAIVAKYPDPEPGEGGETPPDPNVDLVPAGLAVSEVVDGTVRVRLG